MKNLLVIFSFLVAVTSIASYAEEINANNDDENSYVEEVENTYDDAADSVEEKVEEESSEY